MYECRLVSFVDCLIDLGSEWALGDNDWYMRILENGIGFSLVGLVHSNDVIKIILKRLSIRYIHHLSTVIVDCRWFMNMAKHIYRCVRRVLGTTLSWWIRLIASLENELEVINDQ